ncbi:hypothetical protein SM886_000568 [Yersinia enterocolitica]|nr:hypothetical protein [Yersinia enterocolitica]
MIVAATPEIAALAKAALKGCKAEPAICLNNVGLQVAEAVTPGGVGAAGVRLSEMCHERVQGFGCRIT